MNNFTTLKQVIDEHKWLRQESSSIIEHYHVAKRQIIQWWRELVYARERAWQGYDRTELWSHHAAHSERMIEILTWYRHNRCGSPLIYVEGDETNPFTEHDFDIHDRWNAVLDRMIAGFEAADVVAYGTPDDLDFWIEIMDDGLDLYAKNYLSLWD